jgi:hypothetical protein
MPRMSSTYQNENEVGPTLSGSYLGLYCSLQHTDFRLPPLLVCTCAICMQLCAWEGGSVAGRVGRAGCVGWWWVESHSGQWVRQEKAQTFSEEEELIRDGVLDGGRDPICVVP